jgi:glucose-6-phosphate isomerase
MNNKLQNSKFIFVIGIGGSDLASKAVWNALTLHKSDVEKKIFFLESPEVREYEEIKNLVESEILNPNEFVLIAVSKSGKTTETLETFHKIFDILSSKFNEFTSERTLVISTKDSVLWKMAEGKNIECLEWEGDVGGRFSAFTIAHTTVLSIAGLDTESYIAGSKEIKKDEAEHMAKNIFESYKSGFDILDFFIFNDELEDMGKWCRQLIAESLSTITPTVSLGPTDLHSMLELYLGGPKNRFTIFIKSQREIEGSINNEAFENVSKAYFEAGLPFIKYEMEKINEKELGSFMAFMIETTLKLAELLGVDPYGQPAVEEYKKHLAENI